MTGGQLHVDGVSHSFGSTRALDDVSLEIPAGEFVSILGPSGCGKTTLMRVIAGLQEPDGGRIVVDGRDITSLAPERRPTNLVFQRGALFPHMTVAQNIGYPLRRRRADRDEVRERVAEMLALVRLEELGDRRPSELSGGQAQRVALARSLCAGPKILLLDEPLSALDLKLRKALQLDLRALQKRLRTTFVLVTHDQEEALTVSDRVIVLNAGRVSQIGTPRDIYERPADAFVSAFIGETNLLPAVWSPGERRARVGEVALEVSSPPDDAGPCTLSIRPEHVEVRPAGPQADDGGHDPVAGSVVDAVYLGSRLRLRLSTELGQELWADVPTAATPEDLKPGWAVRVTLPSAHLRVLPMASTDQQT